MTTYTITSQHGTHVLMLGTMLIAQASDLEHRHPDRKNNA